MLLTPGRKGVFFNKKRCTFLKKFKWTYKTLSLYNLHFPKPTFFIFSNPKIRPWPGFFIQKWHQISEDWESPTKCLDLCRVSRSASVSPAWNGGSCRLSVGEVVTLVQGSSRFERALYIYIYICWVSTWWLLMAEIRWSPVEVGRLYPIIYRVLYIQTVVVWEFFHQKQLSNY